MSSIEWTDALRWRFWSNVKIGDGCWEWNAGMFSNGYGQFRAGPKKVRAHRAAFMLARAPIPKGLIVCHKCDNPRCVRPGHLFLGTNRDNTADMMAKGRHARVGPHQPGEKNPSAKLTWDRVRRIREARRRGEKLRSIAERFGISQSQVRNIVNNKCWVEAA